MTLEMRDCLKQLHRMYNGLKSIEPGDDEYISFRDDVLELNITADDLQAWSVADFKGRRPPTVAQLKGMLTYCKNHEPHKSNNLDMRFKPQELDAFETAINDYIFLGETRNE